MNQITQVKWNNVYEQLRPYQKMAVTFLCENRRALNFDDMGLGKTVVTLSAVFDCAIEASEFNLVILCTTNALFVWEEELVKWFNIKPIMYIGTPTKRKIIYKTLASRHAFNVVVTTYTMGKELENLSWDAIIADEIHQAGLLKHTNVTYKNFLSMSKNIPLIYLLTGTPVRQGVIDLFAPLHIIATPIFTSYWGFVNRYCNTITTPFGKQIERNPRNIDDFRQVLSHYMIRRLKSEVLKDLPGKQRVPVPIQMTPLQAKAHQEIITNLLYIDTDNTIVAPNKMAAILRARQLLVTPRLLGIDEDGAALDYLKEVSSSLFIANRPFAVFTPFRQALPIIAELFREVCPDVSVHFIHGGMTPAAFANAWQSFESSSNKHKVLISVIKSGASFHATEAADCFFLGYEWDFNLNCQSEDRLCRIGQKNYVTCNYFVHKGTVDEEVKMKLNDKNMSSNWIVGTEEQYRLMLKYVKGDV